jgi:ribosomal protein S18 acetylase RimI-like enzyme
VTGVSRISAGPLTASDVGARVTVRRRLDSGQLSDVTGDLESLDGDELAIRKRDGELAVVAAAAVVAARVVGPSLRSAYELQALSGRDWPALDNEWLGAWWLRAADGFTSRSNSVRVLGDPGRPLDAALAHVLSWYAERGLPPTMRVVLGSSLDAELDRRGWTTYRDSVVQTATLASVRHRLATRAVGESTATTVQLSSQPTASWLAGFRDGAPSASAVQVLTGVPVAGFAWIDGGSDDRPAGSASVPAAVAIGRVAVEEPWAGFSAVGVAADARRRGFARDVMAALADWAAARGAIRGYLEVQTDNAAALALYSSLGFAEHHRYHYRQQPRP